MKRSHIIALAVGAAIGYGLFRNKGYRYPTVIDAAKAGLQLPLFLFYTHD